MVIMLFYPITSITQLKPNWSIKLDSIEYSVAHISPASGMTGWEGSYFLKMRNSFMKARTIVIRYTIKLEEFRKSDKSIQALARWAPTRRKFLHHGVPGLRTMRTTATRLPVRSMICPVQVSFHPGWFKILPHWETEFPSVRSHPDRKDLHRFTVLIIIMISRANGSTLLQDYSATSPDPTHFNICNFCRSLFPDSSLISIT